MTDQEMVQALNRAIALTVSVRDALLPGPSTPVVDLTPGQSIQAAVDGNPAGTTFRLAPGVYQGQVAIRASAHFVPLSPLRNGRAGGDSSVWLTSSGPETVWIAPEADDVSFTGIGCRNDNADGEWFAVQGSRVV